MEFFYFFSLNCYVEIALRKITSLSLTLPAPLYSLLVPVSSSGWHVLALPEGARAETVSFRSLQGNEWSTVDLDTLGPSSKVTLTPSTQTHLSLFYYSIIVFQF